MVGVVFSPIKTATRQPSSSDDDVPLWRLQEIRRKKCLHRQLCESASPKNKNASAVSGRLVGFKIAKPPKERQQVPKVFKRRSSLSMKELEDLDTKFEEISDSVIATADGGTVDGSVSVNELQIFLNQTPHHAFMEWLTGISDGKRSRFHEIDADGSHSIEKDELMAAVTEYYTEFAGDQLEVDYVISKANNEKRKENKRGEIQKKRMEHRRNTIILETRIEMAEETKLQIAIDMIKGDGKLLHKIKSKLRASSYTSGGMDFRGMFRMFDRDGNGTLDLGELKALVRKHLKIPPRDISSVELDALFAFLDEDGGGTLDMDELVKFLEADEGDYVLPSHMVKKDKAESPMEKLCSLINFEKPGDKKKCRKVPPINGPWVRTVKVEQPDRFTGSMTYVSKETTHPRYR